jgi:hypothetical protein
MKLLVGLLSSFLLFSSSLSNDAIRGLAVGDRKPVQNQWANLIAGDVRCDADQNLYFTPATNRGPATLLQISADGKRTTHFPLPTVPALGPNAMVASYFPGENEVYVVGTGPAGTAIVVYDKDGTYRSLIKLELEHAIINQVLPINSARFFIAGTALGSGNRVPFSGIFDDAGRLVSRVNLGRNDVSRQTVSDIPDNPAAPSAYDIAIAGSIADRSGDGNIYFARGTPTGPIFVLSASGQVVHTFRQVSPKGADKLTDMKVAGRRIAIVHEGEPPSGGTAPVWITLIDSSDGKQLSRYLVQDPDIGDLLACYSRAPVDTFTFLNPDKEGRLNIIHAVPK